jgi:hypothetical protein
MLIAQNLENSEGKSRWEFIKYAQHVLIFFWNKLSKSHPYSVLEDLHLTSPQFGSGLGTMFPTSARPDPAPLPHWPRVRLGHSIWPKLGLFAAYLSQDRNGAQVGPPIGR